MKPARTLTLEAVSSGPTINSKGHLTDEYRLRFEGGISGCGSAPQGETLSCYESAAQTQAPRAERVIDHLTADGVIGRELSQRTFDEYLEGNLSRFGPGAVFALSCAFFEAVFRFAGRLTHHRQAVFPKYCLNILNGGRHAYTNPVLSDFHEFLLVPRQGSVEQWLDDHQAIQQRVRARLAGQETTLVAGNPVHVLGGRGNRDCIEFLLEILDDAGLGERYDLMIDAAASDFWDGSAYVLGLAEQRRFSSPELEQYWLSIVEEFPVALLEDPFAEHDLEHWRSLATKAPGCKVLGDDVHCGDARRIAHLLDSACITGVILKPDQAGTISATLDAVKVARAARMPVILSHRSISTDSLLLAHLMVYCDIELAKFGPLLSDFSSVLNMNEVLRLTQQPRPARQAADIARNRHVQI